jgi:hypothetical protein
MLAALALLAGCGSNPGEPLVAADLAGIAQEPRFERCMAQIMRFHRLGVWQNGGARPTVDEAAWEALSQSEQDEMLIAAGCIALGGKPGERIVTITASQYARELATRRVTIPE